MTKLILVEGPDCAGKTTMIDALLARYNNCTTRKGTYTTTDADYSKWLQIAEDNPIVMVLDRCWLSDRIYSKILGTPRLVATQYLGYFESWAEQLNVVRHLMLPPKEVVMDRFRRRGDDYISEGYMSKIYDAYAEVASSDPYWRINS
jgi:thymidylate kinase